jgi:hypothetical protein
VAICGDMVAHRHAQDRVIFDQQDAHELPLSFRQMVAIQGLPPQADCSLNQRVDPFQLNVRFRALPGDEHHPGRSEEQ